MKLSSAAVPALAAAAVAAPSQTSRQQPRQAGCETAVSLDASTNVWESYNLHPNSNYRNLVLAASEQMEGAAAEAAASIADIGTFAWVDTRANIARLETVLEDDIPCDSILGVVVYNLPGRDCAAKASNGELKVGELAVYKTEFIDPIAAILKAHPNQAFALVIEPDSLPNLVTNIDLQTCQDSAAGYREGVAYALDQLNLPNVVMYMDAGHGGWLGWDENLEPGAEELASVYQAAGSPSQFRGIATNVAGWNSWDAEPGEFSSHPDAPYNKAQNERQYVTLFGAALQAAGMPNHAIVDTGRNGVIGNRLEWGHWCNVDGAGFGLRPTADTGHELTDAFVWIKPGGESDGTSDPSAVRYDEFCGKPDAFQPSPEAGEWNQAYFEMLVENANPPL